jgi:hypothetical protein
MSFSKSYKDFSSEVNSLLTQIKIFRKWIGLFLLISNEMCVGLHICDKFVSFIRFHMLNYYNTGIRFYEKILLNSSEREANTKPKKKKFF